MAYGDYRAVFQAFLDMENEEKRVKKESSKKKEEKDRARDREKVWDDTSLSLSPSFSLNS